MSDNIAASVGEDGILIVDDQFEPLADKIRDALGELSEGKLQFVLNTHYHGDHTGGNPAFGDEAHIVAHANVRKRLHEQGKPAAALPVITFTESLTIHFNGEEIRAVHFPNGHTDSDSVVYFTGAKVVHMGDHFFSGRFPYIDIDGGGDVVGYRDNVAKLITELPDDVQIIPGHGPLSTLEDLKTFHSMITQCIELVRSQYRRGQGPRSD